MKYFFWKKLWLKTSKPAMAAGFSLIEVIAVLFIIAVGLVGVLTLIVQNIQAENINKNNLIGCQLVQEGIELIRMSRDNNWRAGRDFSTDLTSGTYMMDYLMATPTPISLITEAPLSLSAGGFYYHATSTPGVSTTTFYRLISLDQLDASKERVRVTVEWDDRGRSLNCSAETFLYDWR